MVGFVRRRKKGPQCVLTGAKNHFSEKKYFGVRGTFKSSNAIGQTTSKKCTKVRAARAARLFSLIQPIISLFSGVHVVAVAVIVP